MIEIIPAILEKTWEEVEKKINLVNSLVSSGLEGINWIQLDIMDGIFVPDAGWNKPSDLKHYLEARPLNLNFEVDLMIKNPEELIEEWIDAGVKRLIVHIESTEKIGKIIKICRKREVEIGLAIDVATSNEDIYKWLEETLPADNRADFIQFMGIAKIGYQGQPFAHEVINKIINLREKYPNVTIQVDGGVSFLTVPSLVGAGVNRLSMGSAIFNSTNPKKEIKELQLIIN